MKHFRPSISLLSIALLATVEHAYSQGQTSSPPSPTESTSSRPATQAQARPTARTAAATATDENRKLMIGDVVSFQVIEDSDPAKRLIVTDAGEIDFPYVGRVKAAGFSCSELASVIKKKLESDYYHKATVLLGLDYNAYGSRSSGQIGRGYAGTRTSVTTTPSQGYTIMGQVNRPGVYPLRPDDDFKLSHAILQSGGFMKFAKTRRVRLLRKDETGYVRTIHVNARDVMDKGILSEDVVIEKGDVIIVDKKLFNF